MKPLASLESVTCTYVYLNFKIRSELSKLRKLSKLPLLSLVLFCQHWWPFCNIMPTLLGDMVNTLITITLLWQMLQFNWSICRIFWYNPMGLFVEWYNTGLHAGLQYNVIDEVFGNYTREGPAKDKRGANMILPCLKVGGVKTCSCQVY